MLESFLNIDTQALLALNGSWGAGWDAFFFAVSGKLIWVPLYLLILFLIYRRGGWKTLLVALVGIGAAVGVVNELCDLLKEGIGRLRPTHTPALEALVHTVNGYRGGLYSTPSAHAANAALVALFGGLIVRRRWFSWPIAAWVLLVSYSRVYLGVHYPGDLLFGWMLAAAVVLLFYVLFRSRPVRKLYETRR
jgi:undecaprenyl-diphosphatase